MNRILLYCIALLFLSLFVACADSNSQGPELSYSSYSESSNDDTTQNSSSSDENTSIDSEDTEIRENTIEACFDGVDNDDDGYSDCADYDCLDFSACMMCGNYNDHPDTEEEEESTQECLPSYTEDTDTLCDDTYDNDLDGLIDCDDPDCLDADICQ